MASFVETSGHAADEGNFEALYVTYKSDVQRLASYLLKNAADAEDAAQTVFLNVLRALRQGVTPADPRAWLLAITRNVCFSRHRAAAARPVQVEFEPEEIGGPEGDETPSADEIVGALARLLPNQRTALILRDFRGVSRVEICDLMSLTPVAVEALLTRARAAFREELEAGEQQFVCDETRTLVEQQLDGLITVADRHSLRSHLRQCAPCSTLARAVRSSRGKVAGLIFWPVDLISRLASAFSQAPTVVHVATAITSTAAVATIAIPAAISTGPSVAHVEGRTAPGPVAAVHSARPASAHPAPVVVEAALPAAPAASPHRAARHALVRVRNRARSALHVAVHKPVARAAAGTSPSPAAAFQPPATAPGVPMHTPSAPPVSAATASPPAAQAQADTSPPTALPTPSTAHRVPPAAARTSTKGKPKARAKEKRPEKRTFRRSKREIKGRGIPTSAASVATGAASDPTPVSTDIVQTAAPAAGDKSSGSRGAPATSTSRTAVGSPTASTATNTGSSSGSSDGGSGSSNGSSSSGGTSATADSNGSGDSGNSGSSNDGKKKKKH